MLHPARAGALTGGGLLATPPEKAIYATIKGLKKCLAELENNVNTYIETRHNNGGAPSSFGIFNPVIDENKLADCFYKIYSNFFGINAKDMLLNDCDEAGFSAYLFVLVENEKLGCDNFKTRSQSKFYNYMQTKVIPMAKLPTLRTFSSRVTHIENLFHLTPAQLQKVTDKTDFDLRNFQKITKFFHNTRYYYLLSKLK